MQWEHLTALNNGLNEINSSSTPRGAGEELFDNPDIYDPLSAYTYGFGQDAKGKYMSIYDKWDLNSDIGNLILESTPEIYDRIYYTKSKDANGNYTYELQDRNTQAKETEPVLMPNNEWSYPTYNK